MVDTVSSPARADGEPRGGARERILDAARRLLVEARGTGVRMGDIAAAAGVSRQAVYLHFPTRAALLVATVRHADEVEGIERRLARYRTARGGVAMLDAYVEFWGRYIPRIHGLAKALLAARETDEAAAAAWNDRMAAVLGGCRHVMDALRAEGKLAPGWTPARAAELLWAMNSVPVWEALTAQRGWSEAQYVRFMKQAARRTFVVEGGGAGNGPGD